MDLEKITSCICLNDKKNDKKLIGAKYSHEGNDCIQNLKLDSYSLQNSPRDNDDHGTHTLFIVGGNFVDGVNVSASLVFVMELSKVAPLNLDRLLTKYAGVIVVMPKCWQALIWQYVMKLMLSQCLLVDTLLIIFMIQLLLGHFMLS